jgi:lipid II:glycine glycyltransferase (peptidoglycan interpeptide bridge formation enzyme)
MPNQYSVRPIDQKENWEKFIAGCVEANFLQSWNWGVFHQNLGKQVLYLGLFDHDVQIGAALCVVEEAKRGRYMAIAGGPLVDFEQKLALTFFVKEIQRFARQAGCLFVRFRPQLIDSPQLRKTVQGLGFMISPMHLTADLTLQLDLTKPVDQLLAEMRKGTRYEVRRAEKLGIVVETSTDPNQIEEFYQHQLILARKHQFTPFSYKFWFEQFKAFAADQQVMLFHAKLNNQILASAFIIFYNHEAVYHYGVSTPANDKLPGSYACQWAAIKAAQEKGCLRYNFWGIAPENQPTHRFAGVSLFKRGFGGEEVQYLPAHDLPLDWRYNFTRAFEFLRKKVRKL